MRLDYEAAEKAYRANMAEQDRQSELGIAVKTEDLTSTASGNYLRFVLQVLRDIRDSGWRAQGATTIRGVVRDGWQEDQVLLTACEDSSGVRFTDKKGRDVTPKHVARTYVQHLTVKRDKGRWRVSECISVSQDLRGRDMRRLMALGISFVICGMVYLCLKRPKPMTPQSVAARLVGAT